MPDAKQLLNQIVGGLEGLAGEPLRLVADDQLFNQLWGWNMPAMNRHDFAAMIRSPISAIQQVTDSDFEAADFATLEQIPGEIAYIQANVMPNLPSGNAFHVYISVDSFLKKLMTVIDKNRTMMPEWQEIEEKNSFRFP